MVWWLSILLLQRILVCFPESMFGRSQPPVTPALEHSTPSSGTCTQVHIPTQRDTIKNKS